MKVNKKKISEVPHKLNFLVIFLVLIICLGVVYYFNQDRIDTTVSELSYPSEVYFDFENDTIGEFPEGWSGTSWDGTQVIYFSDQVWIWDTPYSMVPVQNKVAEVKNRDGEGVELATRFKKSKTGIVEFDIYCNYDKKVGIDLTQMTSEYTHLDDICISLGVKGLITIQDGRNIHIKVSRFEIKTWYHFRIEYNLVDWKLYIDGRDTTLGYDFTHYETPPYYCELYFSTYEIDNSFYIDNINITVIESL